MDENDLTRFFKKATSDLQFEYERIRRRAMEDSGTAGDNAEENWAQILREWLPSTYYVVTKGRIIGIDGKCSPQIDILVLSPYYLPQLLTKKEYLSSGVLAAFECKLTLKAGHIRSAISTAEKIRKLIELEQTWNHTPYGCLFNPVCYGLLSHSHSWKSKDSNPIENVNNAIMKGISETDLDHPQDMIDFICVADLATWTVTKTIRYSNEPPSDPHYGDSRGKIHNPENCINVGMGLYEQSTVKDELEHLFTPIGVFLKKLVLRLAQFDKDYQRMGQYFKYTKLEGIGVGQIGIAYEVDIIPDKTREEHMVYLERNDLPGGKYSEWYTFYN